MEFQILYFFSATLISLALFNISGARKEGCDSPQYLEIGKTGVIQCNFRRDFYGVLWYKSVGFELGTPIIKLFGNKKSGHGYTFGKYDVYPNGSLIVNNVGYLHDRVFTAVKVGSPADDPVHFHINVTTIVKPVRLRPSIGVCRRNERTCYTRLEEASELRCSIWNARPAIALQWIARTNRGDKTVRCSLETKLHNLTHTSHCTIAGSDHHSSLLGLFVCKANNKHGLLLEDEALIFVESNGVMNELLTDKPSEVMVERGSLMELTCTEGKPYLIIWKKITQVDGTVEVLTYGAFVKHTAYGKMYNNEYELNSNGFLVVSNTKVQNEGLYSCSFQNEVYENMGLFEVIVYVPAYPIVKGCSLSQYCVVEGQMKGNLTCSVTGIRPPVQLEWRIVFEHQSSLITFTEREVIINQNDDVFDVRLSSTYRIQPSTDRVTVECAVADTNIEALQKATKFDLLVTASTDKGVVKRLWTHDGIIISIIVGATLIIVIAMCLVACLIWCYCRRKRLNLQRPKPAQYPTPTDV